MIPRVEAPGLIFFFQPWGCGNPALHTVNATRGAARRGACRPDRRMSGVVSLDGPTEPGDTRLCADRQLPTFCGQAGTRRAVPPAPGAASPPGWGFQPWGRGEWRSRSTAWRRPLHGRHLWPERDRRHHAGNLTHRNILARPRRAAPRVGALTRVERRISAAPRLKKQNQPGGLNPGNQPWGAKRASSFTANHNSRP